VILGSSWTFSIYLKRILKVHRPNGQVDRLILSKQSGPVDRVILTIRLGPVRRDFLTGRGASKNTLTDKLLDTAQAMVTGEVLQDQILVRLTAEQNEQWNGRILTVNELTAEQNEQWMGWRKLTVNEIDCEWTNSRTEWTIKRMT